MSLLPFSSLTKVKAIRLAEGLNKARNQGYPSVCFGGAWVGRRLCVADMYRGDMPIDGALHDIDTVTLTLPVTNPDWSEIVKEFSKFGAGVASAYRLRDRNIFESVCSTVNAEIHQVQKFHHVALCGFRGPWLGVDEENPLAVTCPSCAKVASTKPKFRVMFHPLAFE